MTPTYKSLRALWPRSGGTESLGMQSLIRLVDSVDMPFDQNPEYQRGTKWSDERSSRFIGYLCENGEAPVIWVQRWPYTSGKPDELLDGLQRVTAVRRFLSGDIPMELTDGTTVYLRDMSPDDQRQIKSTTAGPTLTIRYVKYEALADVLLMYLRLNRGGMAHEDKDIDRVWAMYNKEVQKQEGKS